MWFGAGARRPDLWSPGDLEPRLPLFGLELVLKLLDARLQLRHVGTGFLKAFAAGQAALEVFVLERSKEVVGVTTS